MKHNLPISCINFIYKNKFIFSYINNMRVFLIILCFMMIIPVAAYAQSDADAPQVEQEQYILERTGDVIVKIFGHIEHERFEEKTLLLTQISPNEKSVTHTIRINGEGYYEFYFIHNWDSIEGNYEVFVSKNAVPIGNVSYELVYDPSYKTDEQAKEEYLMEKEDTVDLTTADYKTGFILEAEAIEGSKVITITGHTTSSIIPITIMVLAPNGNIVSIDQLNPDSENLFTSIINVGGPMWKQDGVYTITGQQGSGSLNKSTVEVEIVDGAVIPEFGAITSLILVVAISSIIALSAKSRLRFWIGQKIHFGVIPRNAIIE